MSTLYRVQGLAALSAFALIMGSSQAFTQEDPTKTRHITIADCPPGYTLGVIDTSEPIAITRAPVVEDNYPKYGTNEEKKSGLEADAVPRQFITGCIPPKTTEQR